VILVLQFLLFYRCTAAILVASLLGRHHDQNRQAATTNHLKITFRHQRGSSRKHPSSSDNISTNFHPNNIILTPLCSAGPNSVKRNIVRLHCLQHCAFRRRSKEKLLERENSTSLIEKLIATRVLNVSTKSFQIRNQHTRKYFSIAYRSFN
jgi:hypothetical protein